jgi:hypothetical protein
MFESYESKSNFEKSAEQYLKSAITILRYSEEEKESYNQKGSSVNFMVKELYRNMLLGVWEFKLGLTYQELMQIFQLPSSDEILTAFGEKGITKEKLILELNNVLSAWNSKGKDRDSQIAGKIKERLIEHFNGQIEKMLGELISTDIDILKLFLEAEDIKILENLSDNETFRKYLSVDIIRQTIFKYELPDSELPKQIMSAINAEGLKEHGEREIVERKNLENIENYSREAKEGEVLVEISPPFYTNFQKYLMIRVYTRIKNAWNVSQYSIPYNSDEVTKVLKTLVNGGRNLLTKDYARFSAIENQQLRQVMKFPTGTDPFKKVLSNFGYIKEYNEVQEKLSNTISKVIQKLMGHMYPTLNELILKLPDLPGAGMFDYIVKQLNLTLVSADIALANNVSANEIFTKNEGNISRQDIVSKTANSKINLEERIQKDTTAGSYESSGDCSSLSVESKGAAKSSGEPSIIEHNGVKLKIAKHLIEKNGEKVYAYKCPKCKAMTEVCDIAKGCSKCKLGTEDWLNMEYNEQFTYDEIEQDNTEIKQVKPKVHRQESRIIEKALGGFWESISPFKTRQPAWIEQ